jgi:hypothetical protein
MEIFHAGKEMVVSNGHFSGFIFSLISAESGVITVITPDSAGDREMSNSLGAC